MGQREVELSLYMLVVAGSGIGRGTVGQGSRPHLGRPMHFAQIKGFSSKSLLGLRYFKGTCRWTGSLDCHLAKLVWLSAVSYDMSE
jgi:hypothetical protein